MSTGGIKSELGKNLSPVVTFSENYIVQVLLNQI